MHLNNAGDPRVQGNAKMHTKEFEREALDFVARLYGFENRYWGYITSGGTEGNLYGMYTGREYFTTHDKKPFFLYAESSHYSLAKNARLFNLESKAIKAQTSSEMDYEHLQSVLSQLKQSEETNLGIIINVNIGATMTGAIDNLKKGEYLYRRIRHPQRAYSYSCRRGVIGVYLPFYGKQGSTF